MYIYIVYCQLLSIGRCLGVRVSSIFCQAHIRDPGSHLEAEVYSWIPAALVAPRMEKCFFIEVFKRATGKLPGLGDIGQPGLRLIGVIQPEGRMLAMILGMH